MQPGGNPGELGLRQAGEWRHRALAVADDGFNACRIQGAQMGIVDQRGRPVAAAGIVAMATGAGGVEIADRLRPVGGAYDRLGLLRLQPEQGRSGAAKCEGREGQGFHGKFHGDGSGLVQDRLGWFGARLIHL